MNHHTFATGNQQINHRHDTNDLNQPPTIRNPDGSHCANPPAMVTFRGPLRDEILIYAAHDSRRAPLVLYGPAMEMPIARDQTKRHLQLVIPVVYMLLLPF